MASRKDKKGRVLRKGESYSASGKGGTIKKDQLDGIDSYAAGKKSGKSSTATFCFSTII